MFIEWNQAPCLLSLELRQATQKGEEVPSPIAGLKSKPSRESSSLSQNPQAHGAYPDYCSRK